MTDWLIATLRTYPELAIFIALAIGFWIGPKKIAGFSLGNVTATLLAAIVVGQLGNPDRGPNQVRLFPALPVRGRLRCRSAILRRPEQGRPAPDHLHRDRLRAVPGIGRDGFKARRISTSAMPRAFMRDRKRSRHRSGSRRTRSIGWAMIRHRSRRYSIASRSDTRSPTSTARSARRSSSHSSGRSFCASISQPSVRNMKLS